MQCLYVPKTSAKCFAYMYITGGVDLGVVSLYGRGPLQEVQLYCVKRTS